MKRNSSSASKGSPRHAPKSRYSPVICSARGQTVQADTNPLFHALISRFEKNRRPLLSS